MPWPEFLQRVKDAGYAGIEWFPGGGDFDGDELFALLKKHELKYCIVTAIIKSFENFETYKSDLIALFENYKQLIASYQKPVHISIQMGRDFFEEQEIIDCISVCEKFSKEIGVDVYQETHRHTWAFVPHVVKKILAANHNFKLTLDLSHWVCVTESLLEDQQDALQAAIERTAHVHARVGHTQGSQVFHPALPEYEDALNAHLNVWDAFLQKENAEGRTATITPEFGPPPYLIKGERSISVTDEQWSLNLWMKELLEKRYNTRE